MQLEDVNLIRESAEILADLNVAATNAFYARLFQMQPDLRPMFPEDMFHQSDKLWETIVWVVESLEDFDAMSARLARLGARHSRIGVTREHYPVVVDALLQTLAEQVGEAWTKSHERAWRAGLGAVAEGMLAGSGGIAA